MARAQLAAFGLTRRAIERRLESGRLLVVHRGVYAVGHRRLTQRGVWMAAVLAAGDGAALSHRSAGGLHTIRDAGGAVDVTVPRQRRQRRGFRIHEAALPADEITIVDGIPVTTVARTLLDLAAVVPRNQLERAVNEAEYRRLADAVSLRELVARHPRHRGAARVRAVAVRPERARNDAEASLLDFAAAHGLPRPELNAYVNGVECDCVWRAQRVILELDGRDAHGTAAAFESDRARDRALTAAGWRVVRVTWRQLTEQPAAVAADLRALLRA